MESLVVRNPIQGFLPHVIPFIREDEIVHLAGKGFVGLKNQDMENSVTCRGLTENEIRETVRLKTLIS